MATINNEFETRTIVAQEKLLFFQKELIRLDFLKVESYLQKDIIFDKPDASLFKSGQKIRVREEKNKVELTYKGKFTEKNVVSTRSEVNVNIYPDSIENLQFFLEKLGYVNLFQIIKERTIYKKDGVSINIDVWPIIGNLAEIEGEESEIIKIVEYFKQHDFTFKNFRLKELFEKVMLDSHQSIDQLKADYESKSGNKLGKIEMIFTS